MITLIFQELLINVYIPSEVISDVENTIVTSYVPLIFQELLKTSYVPILDEVHIPSNIIVDAQMLQWSSVIVIRDEVYIHKDGTSDHEHVLV